MENSYYPWKTQIIADWLTQELANYQSLLEFSAQLNICPHELRAWLTSASPTITLKQIREIARYRQWDIQTTINWLDLKPAHVKELIAQDPSAYAVKVEDADVLLKFLDA